MNDSIMKNYTPILVMLVICFFCLRLETRGQELSKYQPTKVIPPSPTAASLGVYGDLSVGYYSGTPDINIPLYDIKTPNHSLQVRMQYNATGIRVSENAGWVGLGWSLSAGGVITRTVRGLDDFGYQGYYTAGALPPHNSNNEYNDFSINWVEEKRYFDEIIEGDRDGEPDVFTYNFDNYSGKLVLGKRADGSQIFMSERNNLKIEYLAATFNWRITNADGYIFYFGTKESTREDYTYSSDGMQIEDNAPLSRFTYSPSATFDITTAWYLDSIVSPTSESIRFFYARRGHSFSLVSKSEKAYNLLNTKIFTETGECRNSTPDFSATYTFYNASKPTMFEVYLDSIAYLNGSIKFKTTDRKDIEVLNPLLDKPGKLSEIIIRDLAGNRVKKYEYQYSYFNNDATISGRLKLDGILELGSTDQAIKPPYRFNYFNPNNLPYKFAANSIDHWGFYNGVNNKSLLPPKIAQAGNNITHVPGADRNPASAETLKTGVLSSIIYPTGGATHFDFEAHVYTNLRGDQQFKVVPVGKYVYAAPSYIYPYSNEIEIIDLKDTIVVNFNWSYEKVDAEAPDLMNVETIYGDVQEMDKRGFWLGFSSTDICPGGGGGYCNVTSGSSTQVLLPGRYIMSIRHIQGYITRANASWDVKERLTYREGGGIRIKSIINQEQGKPAKIRKFYYTDDEKPGGKSVGKLISPLIYDYRFFLDKSNFGCPYQGDYLARMSNSIYPMGLSSKGTIVGYDKVTEVIGDNGEGGKNVYYFHNAEDYVPEKSYPGMPTYSYPLVGKMAVMATFDSAGTLVRKVDYIYQTKETSSLKGAKLYYEATFAPPASLGNYFIKYYDSSSSWNVLSAEEERLYRMENAPMVTIKKFYHENPSHREVTRETAVRSDGSIIIKKYKYPGDYLTAASGSFVSQMKDKHIVSPVIEEQTLIRKDGVTRLLSGSFTKYQLFHGKFYKPAMVYKAGNSMPLPDTTESGFTIGNKVSLHPAYQPEMYFDHYNDLGNIVQYHRIHDDNYQTYLWGYQQSLPVAEVKNAESAQVFYTGFEEDGTPANMDNPARTGKKYFSNGTYAIPFVLPESGKFYLMSYWFYDNGKWHFSGDVPFLSFIEAGTRLDEVRVYPAGAQMTTYTYDPLLGMTSATDANNVTTYYDYDELGRLKLLKDDKGNILKKYDYHYAGH